MAWFLEHGAQEPIQDQEPPKKKRKTKERIVVAPPPANIPIVRTTIDFHFPETLTTKPAKANALEEDVDFEGAKEIVVKLKEVTQDEAGTRIKLALDMMKGAIVEIDVNELPPDVTERLEEIRRRANDLPLHGEVKLLKSSGQLYTIIRLDTVLSWADGVSATPSQRWPHTAAALGDYQVLEQVYPEAGYVTDGTLSAGTSDFYDSLHVPPKDAQPVRNVLATEMYPFQKRAVAWMLGREGQHQETVSIWSPIKDVDGAQCFVSHISRTIARNPEPASTLSGGILAEEMGLGKTVEIMALISLNKRSESEAGTVEDADSEKPLRCSRATLIITPPSILPQWKSELTKHAPSLKVLHYEGVTSTGKVKNKKSEEELLDEMCTAYDVVLTTYNVLGKEIHFAEDPPQRNMRQVRKYERKRSPLVLLDWWRVCLDEAQMVESGVSAAARVACRLPRVHSWAVSGTPLKKNLADLQGLLIFLKIAPFNTDNALWDHLIHRHKHLFRQLFGTIAMRHTKAHVREDLHLPPQKRIVITMPFTALEQQRYSQLFEEMCSEVGVTLDGAPSQDDWVPEDHTTAMRTWLVRLRQTCLHPQVGTHNRRALGRGRGPLRTVEEVLHVMIEQNELSTRTEERSLVETQLHRGHVMGNAKDDENRSQRALEVYTEAMGSSSRIVQDARDRLKQAIKDSAAKDGSESDSDSSTDATTAVGRLKNNLKTALALHHACVFFTANATFQIKAAEHLTPPDSDKFREFEERETELYELAKRVRQEILRHASEKADKLTQKIERSAMTRTPVLKDLESSGGIESRRIVDKTDELFDLLRDQTDVIVEWREKMAEYLSKPLVDHDEEGQETTGEEYEASTKEQDELYAYFDAFKAMLADLNTFVTGEDAPLIDHEVKGLIKDGRSMLCGPIEMLDPKDDFRRAVHAPELLLKLLNTRNNFRAQKGKVGSLRGLIQEVRQLEGAMDMQVGNARAEAEQALAKGHLNVLQRILHKFTKALEGFEKELDLFRSTQNQRLEFYRQLQELSDDVTPWKEELDETLDTVAYGAAESKEAALTTSLNRLRTTHRFLTNLRDESGAADEPRVCVICQSTFENGVLTVCGHQYCKECIQLWWSQHKTCPICKRHLVTADFHNITYKPREIRAQEEASQTSPTKHRTSSSPADDQDHPPSSSSSIYTSLPPTLLSEIKSHDLPDSYGTKIDTLARHLLWLRTHDPGAKSILFSQFPEFLDVLSSALTRFKIGHARLSGSGRAQAVEKFRYDVSVDALLLDAKTDSSGLTLVEATHVFVCEPLVQTAVEAQAVARVHRIGQTRRTTVWMYLVEGSVEERVYELSVRRRLEHVQQREEESGGRGGEGETSKVVNGFQALNQSVLDAADSAELQSRPLTKLLAAGKTGGEHVQEEDLWTCLFGRPAGITGAVRTSVESGIPVGRDGEHEAVGRFLRGEVAECRREMEVGGSVEGAVMEVE